MNNNATQHNRHAFSAILRGVFLGILLGTAFLAGFIIRGRAPAVAEENPKQNFRLLDEVSVLLEQNYLRDMPSSTELEYAAVRGYISEIGDPYTFFIDPPVAQNESDVLAGQYGGIGVQLTRNERGEFVLYPYRNSPALTAGVTDGAVLLSINGTPLPSNERLDVIDRMLRGEVGENRGVTITVQQNNSTEPQEFFIPFAVVEVPSVIWRVLEEDPRIGYIQIQRFTSRTPDETREALTDLTAQGAIALVLDLRGNPGGLLQESVEVASEFLDGGIVFYERRRTGETSAEAAAGGTATNQPLLVLVNNGTASAAELVAGAIRDRDRGMLIGQKTYGKGSVQLIFRLSDGSSIHITAAEWFTPAHTPLDGTGLEPDISMIPAEDNRDVELGEAVRQLQQLLVEPANIS